MARSICAGLRGGSTAMGGTSTGTAPYAGSRSLISLAWSLVRGTSTRQPNSGRLSHQDSRLRLSTAVPTVATTGPLSASTPAVFSATATSLVATLFCAVPEPPGGTTTGVLPDRPPSTSRAAASGSSSAVPCRTRVPPAAEAAPASPARSAPLRRSAVRAVLPSATPAKAGTAVAVATPGTTSKGTEVRPTASTSLTTVSAVYGSPATSRTTTLPLLAAATAALATSAGSPVAVLSSACGCASRTASWTATETSGSTRTTAAPTSAAVARAVSMPGSPGPAPTKTTRPALPEVGRLRVIGCS